MTIPPDSTSAETYEIQSGDSDHVPWLKLRTDVSGKFVALTGRVNRIPHYNFDS